MRILVAVASKHGATWEIGDAITRTLRQRHFDTFLSQPLLGLDLRRLGAVICGSAVYGGAWRPDAVSFIETRGDELRALPVWLFEAGAIGLPGLMEQGRMGAVLGTLVAARELKQFPGRIDLSLLSPGERTLVQLLEGEDCDERDFDDIAAWAEQIADVLDQEGQVGR